MQTEVSPKSVRSLRLAHGWSQRELASRAHIAMQTVLRIERGEECNPITAEAIMRALKTRNVEIKLRGEGKRKELSSA